MPSLNEFISAIGFGIVTGSIIALGGVGATFQIGITNFVNFAYGNFMTVGAYFALVMINVLHLGVLAGLAVGAVGTGIVAVICDMTIFQPFLRDRKVSVITMTVVTVALSLILTGACQAIWGATSQTYDLGIERELKIGPFSFTSSQLIIIAVTAAAVALFETGLRVTKLGKALRAMSDNLQLAQASGIGVRALTRVTWLISGAFAGLAGVVLVITTRGLTPTFGLTYLFVIMSAVVIGGLGRPIGTVVASLFIGQVMEIGGIFINAAYLNALAFGALILALVFRPNGLFAAKAIH